MRISNFINAYKLRVFENRILRRVFELKRDENGKWRRLHHEKLHRLYRTHNIVRMIKFITLRWTGHEVRLEESRSTSKVLTGKPRGNISLGRPRWR